MLLLSFEIPIQVKKFLKVFNAANFGFLPNVPKLIIKAKKFVVEGQKAPPGGGFALNKKGTFFLINNGGFLTVFCAF